MSTLKTKEFLQLILPSDGYYCAGTLDNKKFANHFFDNLDALSNFLQQQDTLGKAVYHACSTYKGRAGGRKQENVAGVQSFWLDIDAGPKARYATQSEAAVALYEFCERIDTPYPLLVSSGLGLHAYWPLGESLVPAVWERYAQGLKVLCKQHGLHADPSRTSDSASVLRPIGTHNRKTGDAIPVTLVGEIPERYELAAFDVFLSATPAPVERTAKGASLLAQAINMPQDYEPSSAVKIAENCNQLACMRDTKGNIPEPEWYAGICLMQHCSEGPELVHEWSIGYEGYSPAETDQKIAHAEEAATGPTTCERYADLNPEGCQGCPFRGQIKSPISLGRMAIVTKEAVQELPKLPWPYKFKNGALVVEDVDEDGNPETSTICSSPVFLSGVHRGEADRKVAYQFRRWASDTGWDDLTIPGQLINTPSCQGYFDAADTNIQNWKLFKHYIVAARDFHDRGNKPMTRYDQFGWKNGNTEFVLGDRLYTQDGVRDITLSPQLDQLYRQHFIKPPGGSLRAYISAVHKLFVPGLEPQAAAYLMSAASPLMPLTSKDPGGTVISLYSPRSGTGKTTGMVAGMSLWGRTRGMMFLPSDTPFSVFRRSGQLGCLPVGWDELRQDKDPNMIRNIIHQISQGTPRLRGQADGSVEAVELQFNNLTTTTTNHSLLDICGSAGGGNAQGARVFEILVDIKTKNSFSWGDRLKADLDDNRGYAGEMLVRALTDPNVLPTLTARLQRAEQWIHARLGVNMHDRYLVRALICIDVACDILCEANLLAFDKKPIMDFLMDAAERSRITVTSPNEMSLTAIAQYIADNFRNTLIMSQPYTANKDAMNAIIREPSDKLHIRLERAGSTAYLDTKPLREWCLKHGEPYREMARTLRETGALVGEVQIGLGAGTVYSAGRVYAWKINLDHPALSGVAALVREDNPAAPVSTLAASLSGLGQGRS